MTVRTRFAGALVAGLAGLLAFAAVPATAVESGPRWAVNSVSSPTNFKPGPEAKPGENEATYKVTLTNAGSASTNGSPVQITDELPQGLALDPAGAFGEDTLAYANGQPPRANFSCLFRTCTYTGVVVPDQTLAITFPVDVEAGAPTEVTSVLSVSGGGAPTAQVQTPTAISSSPAGFGFAPGGSTTALSTDQAGAHPDLTTTIAFNTTGTGGTTAGFTKDTSDLLPPGFAADLIDTPSCTGARFAREECAIGTQVGVVAVSLGGSHRGSFLKPVYNLSPNAGEVAKIGFVPVREFLTVEGGITLQPGDYRASTDFADISQSYAPIDEVSLTVWGVPAEAVHDPLRWNGLSPGEGGHFGHPSEVAPAPFLTNPTSCGAAPLQAEFRIDSWEEPQRTVTEQMPFGPLLGCDRLTIEPSLTAEVSTNHASSPTGFDLATSIPQTYDNAAGLATSTLKKEVVTLPEGMTVNPSAGAGLAACSEAQYAEEGTQYVAGKGCPSESKLATVEITTPSLSEHVKGSVFLAEPAPFGETHKNPFNSLLAVYLIARIPDRGVLIKSPGEVQPNLETGRLVTTFDDLPPLPFSLATFSFNQGANAPLVTPPACGSYTVQAQLTPYADPEGAPVEPLIPPFSITTGVGGGPCPAGGVPPFAPGVTAGTEDPNAGAYSPLNILIARNDGEQEITGFASQLPPGLTANLSGVPFCSEAGIELARRKTGAQEEAQPSCPVASEIGHTLADAGVGPVLAQAPGKLYMAGPFQGAPFSVVAITSAKVGPFDLGTVVVHLPLFINPQTAAVSIPAGAADQIPHIIKGIVIHVREIRVYIDRQDFTLNPTNCDPLRFSATVIGGGADPTNPADNDPVTVADPFRVTACQALKFKPAFKVTTSGKTSRSKGASLSVKLTYPNAPQGTQANIKSVKVDLPKQLPSRLTTLQKACTADQFNTNPAGCPAASVVGHATAITPLIPVPLVGPAYFVSHGGEAFPSLIVVLQGYGITIDLVGSTFISKSGITSSTFKTVPDQPVTSFELTLPQGKFSALAANGNLCSVTNTVTVKKKVTVRVKGHKKTVTRKVKESVAGSLTMPTAFVAQNGAVIHQSTPIAVTGCPKAKKAKANKRKGEKGKRGGKKK
jgi:uncharacterized repeat protein (TIGR01451 family)